MAENKRIVWIDQLRGLAFYTVILGHLSLGESAITWIYSFHMPLFFMISGYTLNISKVYKTGFKECFSKLFKGLLVPYAWMQLICFALRFVVSLIRNKPVSVKEYLFGIIIGHSGYADAPSNPLYYVLLLFLAQMGLWLLIRVAKGKTGILALLAASLSLLSIFTQNIDLPWHINVVPMAILFILTGRFLMEGYLAIEDRIQRTNKMLYVLFCLILIAIGFLLSHFNGKISIHGNEYGRSVLIFLLSAVVTSIAFSLLVMLLPGSKVLTFIGRNTLLYMGIHKPVLLIAESLFRKQNDTPEFILIASVVCFFGLIPVAWLFNRYMPYVCGKSTENQGVAFKACKYIVLAVGGAVPYLYFLDDYISDNFYIKAALWIFYFVAVFAVERVFTKCVPFMFLLRQKESLK